MLTVVLYCLGKKRKKKGYSAHVSYRCIFVKSLRGVAGYTDRYVAHRQGEMTVLETYPSQLNTQVGRDGINDNQDIVPDPYLSP